MSTQNQEGSVRQLPPGKLSNIKKLFEDGESANKPDRRVPPARPTAPPSRVKSPVRQQPTRQPSISKAGGAHKQQLQASLAVQAAEQAIHLKDHSSTGPESQTEKSGRLRSGSEPSAAEMRGHRKLSPTVSRRITALMDNDASPAPSPQPPRPVQRVKRDSNGSDTVLVDNPAYVTSQDVSKGNVDISEMYSKVNKLSKNTEASPKKVMFGAQENTNIHRREAVRKNSGERRKTVASFEPEAEENESSGVNVALRTKLFDKPAPPKKSDSVKRQFSMRTAKELEQQQHKLQHANRTHHSTGSTEQEAIYDPPWDMNKSAVVEKLKKAHPPPTALTPPTVKVDHSANNVTKSAVPVKPPLPNVPLKKSDLTPQRAAGRDSAVEAVPRNLVKTKPSESTSASASPVKVGPPPKPPRTHAHDQYMKVKISQNLDAKPSPESSEPAVVRKTVQVVEPAPGSKSEEAQEEVEYLSVKDRISKMQQKGESSSPLPLPSASFSSANKDESIAMRHQPPSRPPPPKRRPNSGGNPADSMTRPPLPRPLTQFPISRDSGPLIIPVSPRQHQALGKQLSNMHELHSRHPSDQLPPEPGQGRPLQKFPLRKSFSSECLHSSRGSSLNLDVGDDGDNASMSQSSHYGNEYEAVLDPDGYAIPHEFMRLPGKKKHSAPHQDMDNVSPGKFLTRLEGFGGGAASEQDGSPRWGAVTSTQEQSLDKVNKKKMIMVRQKINQAYADLDIASRSLVDTPGENDWQIVQQDQDSAEAVVEPTELKKRIEYCASVRLKSSKSIKRSKEYLSAIYPQLFEYCLVVGLRTLVDTTGYEAYVIHKFPENFEEFAVVSSNLSVPSFCFPDASIFKPGTVTSVSESYSFVMTYQDGTRVYGYCRRIQPPDASLPEVICIISPIDAFNMYNTLLNEIETRRRASLDLATELIAASFGRPLPKPGKVCHIRTLDKNGEMETIFLNRSSDNKLDNVNYESPLHYLGTDKLVKVFSSMLMERRIILCSSNLSVLTQTVHALAALLYPFQWQHVYIPLLPGEMLDVVCAPMPYIVGVLTAFLPQVLKMELEEVFIVDLDKKSIVKSQGDESTILPRKVQKALRTAINMPKVDPEARNAQWLMVAEAFLRMFIETVGHFNNHIRTQQDGNRIFQKEGFILDVISKELRQFLEWFTETQMFEVFIVNHVDKSDYGTSDLFLQRLAEYKESKEESSRHKGLGAKVKNFGKALKTKLQAS